jgi:hypothetical protein
MPDILSFQVELSESVEEVVDKVTSALQEEGYSQREN